MMKKILFFSILVLNLFFVVACNKKELDTVPPFLRVLPKEVEIVEGDYFDLMLGVQALDDIDGDITNKVIVDDSLVFYNEPGTYSIYYSVKDSSNNESVESRTVTILADEILRAGYSNAPVYNKVIEGEVPAPTSYSPYPGDWSNKARSSKDRWLGMEATFTLPSFEGDSDRYEDETSKYLDNPSIYFGSTALLGAEGGLSYEKGVEVINGKVVVSREKNNFRPFWRNILDDGENVWNSSPNLKAEYFYFPGDKLRMSMYVLRDNYLQLKIEVIEPTKIEQYVEFRKEIGVSEPKDFLSTEFRSKGVGTIFTSFQRANAIDQYYNEGKPTHPTNAKVLDMIWHEVYLYRKIDDIVYKVPFTEERRIQYQSPDTNGFLITYDGVDKLLGGEKVSIIPGNAVDYVRPS